MKPYAHVAIVVALLGVSYAGLSQPVPPPFAAEDFASGASAFGEGLVDGAFEGNDGDGFRLLENATLWEQGRRPGARSINLAPAGAGFSPVSNAIGRVTLITKPEISLEALEQISVFYEAPNRDSGRWVDLAHFISLDSDADGLRDACLVHRFDSTLPQAPVWTRVTFGPETTYWVADSECDKSSLERIALKDIQTIPLLRTSDVLSITLQALVNQNDWPADEPILLADASMAVTAAAELVVLPQTFRLQAGASNVLLDLTVANPDFFQPEANNEIWITVPDAVFPTVHFRPDLSYVARSDQPAGNEPLNAAARDAGFVATEPPGADTFAHTLRLKLAPAPATIQWNIRVGLDLIGAHHEAEDIFLTVQARQETSGPGTVVAEGHVILTVDKTLPYVVSVTKQAASPNKIDVIFSEAVTGSGASGAIVNADLQYVNVAPGGATSLHATTQPTDSTIGDNLVTMTVNANLAAADLGLDALKAMGTVKDLAGNKADATTRVPIGGDGSPPYLVSARGNVSTKDVVVKFSEGVDDGAGGGLSIGDFAVANSVGTEVGEIVRVVHTAGDSYAFLELNQPLSADQAGGVSAAFVQIFADRVFAVTDDESAHAAQRPIADSDSPIIADAQTLDTASPSGPDGKVDAIRVKFSEAVTDSSILAANEWFVGGIAPQAVITGDANHLPNAQNDNVIFLLLGTDGIEPNTGALPVIEYRPSSGRVNDTATPPNRLLPTNFLKIEDAAPPRLLQATTEDLTSADLDGDGQADVGRIDAYRLHFSESMDLASIANGWVVEGTAFTGFEPVGDDVRIRFAERIEWDAGSTPQLLYDPSGGAKDLAGLPLPAVPLSRALEFDRVAPTVLAMGTVDADSNGFIDGIEITFSEPIDDQSLDAGDWTLTPSLETETPGIGTGSAPNVIVRTFRDDALGTGQRPSLSYTSVDMDTLDVRDLASPPNLLSNVVARQSADAARPLLLRGSTEDLLLGDLDADGQVDDPNGLVDAYLLRFSEPIDIASFSTLGWAVAGTGITGFEEVGDDIRLKFHEQNALDAGSKPGLSYNDEIGTATDLQGLPLQVVPEATNVERDAVAPRVLHLRTVDLNSNGFIDGIEITLSESVDDSTLDAGDWTITSSSVLAPQADSINTGTNPNDKIVVRTFQDGVLSTAAQPSLSYSSADADLTDLKDLASPANLLDPLTPARQSLDGAPPILTAANTRDADADGRLDGYTIAFSEPVDDTSLMDAAWRVDGEETTVTTGILANDMVINVAFVEGLEYNTGATPQLQYWDSNSPPMRDSNGLALASMVEDAAIAESDGAAPRLVRAAADVGSRDVFLLFSENVQRINGGDIPKSALRYTDATRGGAGGFSSLTHTAGTPTAAAVLNVPLSASDQNADTVKPLVGPVEGIEESAVGRINALDLAVPITPRGAPSIESMTTLDVDGDGRIDGVRVEFDEVISDGVNGQRLVPAEWTLASPYGDDDGHPVDVITGDATHLPNAPDDKFIFLVFDPAGESGTYDTGANPIVAYNKGSIVDTEGFFLENLPATPTADGLPPRPIQASTFDDDADGHLDGVRIRLTESIDVDALSSVGWESDGPPIHTVATGSAPNEILVVFTDVGPNTGAIPDITYQGESIQDSANNAWTRIHSDDLLETDGAPPVVLSAVTQDADGDGKIDGHRVSFSEPLQAPIGPLGWNLDGSSDVDVVLVGLEQDRLLIEREAGVVDTGAIPVLTYDATVGLVADPAGKTLASIADEDLAEQDGVQPRLFAALTRDFDVDGLVDGIHLTFTEALDDGQDSRNLDTDAWSIGAPYGNEYGHPSVVSTGDIENDELLVLLFDEVGADGTDGDTDAMPLIEYDPLAGSLTDAAGNPFSPISEAATDDVAPIVLSASTRDHDEDGNLESYHIRLSEPLNPDTVNPDPDDPNQWFIAGVGTKSLEAVGQNLFVYFEFEEFSDPWLLYANDTGAVPELTYVRDDDSATHAADHAGLLLADIGPELPELDGAKPIAKTAAILDQDADGHIDLMSVLTSEIIVASTFDGWEVAGYEIDTTNSFIDEGPPAVNLALQEFGDYDTGALPQVTYEQGGIMDAAENGLSSIFEADLIEEDVASPIIVGAMTQDQDGNGQIDAYLLTFSEGLASVGDTFSVDGYTVTGFEAEMVAPGGFGPAPSTAFLKFAEARSPDTGIVPQVTCFPCLVSDAAGNLLADLLGTSIMENDGAVPQFTAIETRGDGLGHVDGLIVEFSEAVDVENFTSADFALTGCAPVCANIVVSPRTPAAILLEFNPTGSTATTPSLAYARADGGASIKDSVGLPLVDLTAAVVSSDRAVPLLTSAQTYDTDADGRIDGYEMAFSETMDIQGLNWLGWAVDDYTIMGIDEASALATLFLRVQEKLDGDTDATPELTYVGDSTRDVAGNALAGLEEEAVQEADGAFPILMQVGAQVGDRVVTARFSEPIQSINGGAIGAADVSYDDVSAGGASAIVAIDHAASSKDAILTFNNPLTQVDVDNDRIRPIHERIRESAHPALPVSDSAVRFTTGKSAVAVGLVSASIAGPRAAIISWHVGATSDVEHARSWVEWGTPQNLENATEAVVGRGAKQMTLTGLTPSTDYAYRVIVRNSTGTLPTATSREHGFTTSAPILSAVKTNLITPNGATVEYFVLGSNSGLVTYVEFNHTATPDSPLDRKTPSSPGVGKKTANLTQLANVATYKFRVVAALADGTILDFSPVQQFTTHPLPGVPMLANVTVSDVTTTSAKVTWDVRGNESIETRLRYGMAAANMSVETAPQRGAGRQSVLISALPVNTTIHYRVVAVQSFGPGNSTSVATFKTAPPPSISDVTITNLTKTTARVTWIVHGDSSVKTQLRFGTSATSITRPGPVETGPGLKTTLLTGLSTGTTYHYQITVSHPVFPGVPGVTATFHTVQDSPVIADVRVENISASAATIRWSISSVGDLESLVEYGPSTNLEKGTTAQQGPGAKSITLTNLAPDTTYHARVKAKPANGPTAESQIIVFATAAVLPPTVADLIIEQAAEGGARLTWSQPSAANLAGYLVWRSQSPFVVISDIADADNTTYTDRDADFASDAQYVVTYYLADGRYQAQQYASSSAPAFTQAHGVTVRAGAIHQAAVTQDGGFSGLYAALAVALVIGCLAMTGIGMRRRRASPMNLPQRLPAETGNLSIPPPAAQPRTQGR